MNTFRIKFQTSSNHTKTLVQGSLISIIAVIGIGIVNLFIRRSLALYLTPVEYGYIYSIFSLLSILIAIFDAGLTQSSVILIAKKNVGSDPTTDKYFFGTLFTLRLTLALILTSITLLAAHRLAVSYFKNPEGTQTLQIMSLWMGGMIVAGALSSLFEGTKNFIARQALYLCYYGIALSIILMYKGQLTPEIAGSAMSIGIASSCIFSVFYIRRYYGLPLLVWGHSFKQHLTDVFYLSKWVLISAAGITIMFNMDSVMLTYFKGLYSVGLYNVAIPIMQIILSVMLVFPQVFAPIATELWHLHEHRQLRRLLQRITATVFILGGLGLFIIYPLRDWIITFLFSEQYRDAATVVTLLVAGIPFYIAGQIHLTVLNGMGHQKFGAVTVLSSLVLNIFLNIMLIPRAGINGAGQATLLSYIYLFLVSVCMLRKHLVNAMK